MPRCVARRGTEVRTAVFATARKLAQLANRILRCGQEHVGEGEAAYEEHHRQRTLVHTKGAARDLGYTQFANAAPSATPDPAPAPSG